MAIQYGGIKYPYNNKDHLQLKYVELRLEGQFLEALKVYDIIRDYMVDVDAYGWLKYKFLFNIEELKRAKKITGLLAKAMEKKFGLDYLVLGIDKNALELPRIKHAASNKYDQQAAVQSISEMLLSQNFEVSRASAEDSPITCQY